MPVDDPERELELGLDVVRGSVGSAKQTVGDNPYTF